LVDKTNEINKLKQQVTDLKDDIGRKNEEIKKVKNDHEDQIEILNIQIQSKEREIERKDKDLEELDERKDKLIAQA